MNLFADMPNKLDNLWLHPSPFALKAAFQIEDGKTNLTYGKGPRFVPHALFSGDLVVRAARNVARPAARKDFRLTHPSVLSLTIAGVRRSPRFVYLAPERSRVCGPGMTPVRVEVG